VIARSAVQDVIELSHAVTIWLYTQSDISDRVMQQQSQQLSLSERTQQSFY